MSLKKCMVVVVLSLAVATGSFALVASDESFGVTESSVSGAVEEASGSAAAGTPKLDGGCGYCPGVVDCNGNCEDDRCDVDCSASGIFCQQGYPANDLCNGGHFPSCGTSADCNSNGVPDECEGVECCSDADCGRFKCCGQITANKCDFCIE